MYPAHNTAKTFNPIGVGNNRHTLGQRIVFVIQRRKDLTAFGPVDAQGTAGDFIRIKHVQGPVAVIGEEICHINKRRDRPQPNGFQAILQPCGARAVFHALDHPAVKHGTLITRIFINRHCYRTGKPPGNRRHILWLEPAQAARGEITRDTAHAKRIRPVRGDGDFNDSIDLGGIMHGQPIDKQVTNLARRQLNDAIMFVRQLHFTL